MKLAASKVGDEPIPGYTLRKRLGAGGYGEVWLSDAPGGLQKAVKLIYGTVEQSHASSELKSLERMLDISHPFLLSLERIQVVENQVVIVTELAESSLRDRYENCRRKGEPGIPRSTLLEFMRDTADALDFLAQKHNLQHLDVKPGNLLILADRVKVADFGLVKDLQDQNQSLVNGLTPTYSAPEIFDGRPDHRSDQYSLAIVFMEMLTGHLPFAGKTTAELARQHMSQSPNLEGLPPADRQIIGRALAKNPLDRFNSCRQLIDQLQKVRSTVIPQLAPVENKEAVSDSTKDYQFTTNTFPTKTAATFQFAQAFQEKLPQEAINPNWAMSRAMYIGVGGMGCEALAQMRRHVCGNCDGHLAAEDLGWLAIDTTADTLDEITNPNNEYALPGKHAIQLPLYKPAEYRKSAETLFSRVSRRWLYNIPKSLTTEGVRPLSTLALLDHYDDLYRKLEDELGRLIEAHNNAGDEEPLRVYVYSSLHGGTGSGMLVEIGNMIRIICRERGFTNYRSSCVISCAMTTNSAATNLPAAGALCCLSELVYQMGGEEDLPPIHRQYQVSYPTLGRPFDWATIVDGGLYGNVDDAETTVGRMAKYSLVDSHTQMGRLLAENRISTPADRKQWLRTACADNVVLVSMVNNQVLSRWCTQQALAKAAAYMSGPQPSNKSSVAQSPLALGATVSGDMPLTAKAIEDFTNRLLSDLGVYQSLGSLSEIAGTQSGNALLSKWARRLSGNPDLIAAQIKEDIQVWKDSIQRIVCMKIYNWRQVEKIQLKVIEGILDYCDQGAQNLVELFKPFANTLGTPQQMLGMAVRYLRLYSEECVKLLGNFQRAGASLAEKLTSWSNSVNAEQAMNEANNLDLLSMPQPMQVVATRVMECLDSALHNESLKIIDEAAAKLHRAGGPAKPLIPDNLTLRGTLMLASETVQKMTREMRLDFEQMFEDDQAQSGVTVSELDGFSPPIAQFGSQTFRFVVAPEEQHGSLQKSLQNRQMDSTTTLLESAASLGTLIACDAGQINLPQFLAAYFRPSASTMQLAERLHIRNDVDWPPLDNLFELQEEADATSVPPITTQGNNFSSPSVISH